jgi:hypothetical protein
MAKNNKISKKGTFGTTMGVTSIIAILVILVLIVFSALSITTSKADLTLAEKTAAATSEFYKADSAAEKKLAEVSEAVKRGGDWQNRLTKDGYAVESTGNGRDVSYDVKIDDAKSLFVVLTVDSDGHIERTLWQVRSTTEWEPDNSLAVIK